MTALFRREDAHVVRAGGHFTLHLTQTKSPYRIFLALNFHSEVCISRRGHSVLCRHVRMRLGGQRWP